MGETLTQSEEVGKEKVREGKKRPENESESKKRERAIV